MRGNFALQLHLKNVRFRTRQRGICPNLQQIIDPKSHFEGVLTTAKDVSLTMVPVLLMLELGSSKS
jgi:hypothetical protein